MAMTTNLRLRADSDAGGEHKKKRHSFRDGPRASIGRLNNRPAVISEDGRLVMPAAFFLTMGMC
jgi:hypothetical protein